MTDKIILQHYVPRFYLKNFSFKKEKGHLVNCFDKVLLKKFTVDIRKIGCEKQFYDTSFDTEQVIEKRLGQHESKFNVVCDKIIKTEDLESLSEEERKTTAFLIASQWLRTREQREIIQDGIKQLTERLSKEKLSASLENRLKKAATDESVKMMHLQTINETPEYVEILLDMKWVLLKNKTDSPYWTSDNPVTLYNPMNLSPYGNLGLVCRGIQLFFPLNSTVSICLCDPTSYVFPQRYEVKDIQNIIFQNHLQVKYSTRHIITTEGDFSLADKMIKNNPELGDINRKRISLK
jgi:hypothetical protein